ncbi:LysM peptidoglycan-binding domain-containing protein [Leuconostoc lactis]|uniref:LysM peptidoglycan-binding domain-containing protein n=2 Tax=Leuconostoc TaxID=1243 RepID=UPI00020D9E7D|nr:LysM peptidoglycan-binding domain-containing protein [Leuconostoc lactis]MCT3115869.1 LysM peptidoglycan-binding domain-containing protein [Leuconostoc lactis]ORI84296.1 peptidoglycan-binding protein LysM [Leuconostoc lactis]ORI86385.1 peptidoglycan-binding protein LysM [Leuconostoc lactis]
MVNKLKKTMLATAAGVAALVGGHAAASADTVEVKAGDTLSGIAQANNTTTDELAKVNNISDHNLIIAGQTLTVADTKPAAISADGTTYTVQAGDSLSKVAEHTGVNVATLKALNGLSSADLIVTGQTLALKAAPVATAPTVTAAEQAQDLTYIAAADANKDGFMSLDEYNTFKANGGDVNQTAAKPAETVTVPENVAYIAAADTNKDGFMSAAEYQAYQANGGAAAAAQPQQAAPAAASVPENVTYIAAADTNKDGFMSAAEYQAYKANGGATAAPAQPVARVTNGSTQQAAAPVASSAVQTILNSLNAKRAALGLAPVRLDAGLSARAQARAYNAVNNGGLPSNHFSTNGEVVAIGWSAGTVINAWYNETNMMTNGTPGHQMWVANARASAVGFGIVGNTIVGVSDAGQY